MLKKKFLHSFTEHNLKAAEHKDKHFKGRPSKVWDVMLRNVTERRSPQLYHGRHLKSHAAKKLCDNEQMDGSLKKILETK